MNLASCYTTHKRTTLLLMSLLSGFIYQPLMATAPEPTAPAPLYHIELLVISPTDSQLWLSERWPAFPTELEHNEQTVSVDSGLAQRRLLRSTDLRLSGLVQRLLASDDYRISAYLAWQQPANLSDAQQVIVSRLPDNINLIEQQRIQGLIQLSKQRYEHVELTLQCQQPIPIALRQAFAEKQQRLPAVIGDHWQFYLQEKRKINLNELNYFDHPMCGVFMLVNLADAPHAQLDEKE